MPAKEKILEIFDGNQTIFQLGVETNKMCQRKFFIHQICLFLLIATLLTARG